VDFDHLWDLERRGVFWVTRAKENLQFEVVQSYPVKAGGKIVSDELVGLKNAGSQKVYPGLMRRVAAWVEVDGQERLMTFLTNQPTWSPDSVAQVGLTRSPGPAMGQPQAAFAIWGGRTRRFSRGLSESVGQPPVHRRFKPCRM
jgi:hypothetical protein